MWDLQNILHNLFLPELQMQAFLDHFHFEIKSHFYSN